MVNISIKSEVEALWVKLTPANEKRASDRDFRSINKKITAIEEALYQTKAKSSQDVLNFPIRLNDKLAGLYGVASSGQNPPSKQAKEAFAELGGLADVQLGKLKLIMENDVKALNKLINEKQVPVIGIK